MGQHGDSEYCSWDMVSSNLRCLSAYFLQRIEHLTKIPFCLPLSSSIIDDTYNEYFGNS